MSTYDDLSGYLNTVNVSGSNPYNWSSDNDKNKPPKPPKSDAEIFNSLSMSEQMAAIAAANQAALAEQAAQEEAMNNINWDNYDNSTSFGEFFEPITNFGTDLWNGLTGLFEPGLPAGNASGPIHTVNLPPYDPQSEQFATAGDTGIDSNYPTYPYSDFDETMNITPDGNGFFTSGQAEGEDTTTIISEDATGLNEFGTETGGDPDPPPPPPPNNPSSGGGSSVSSVVDGLLEAIAERDAALARKQGSLSDRYAEFGDTYITNLNDAYSDMATGDYDSEYEAAKASIWNNIKAQGLLDQTDVDARLSKVNDAYAAKDETINTLADAFTSGIRSQLGGTYDSTLSGLNALAVDGSSPEDYINQTQAINSFDVITPFNQYSSVTPNEEDFENIDMFSGFDQYYGEDDLSTAFDESDYNVQAVSADPNYQGSASTISAVDAIKSGGRDPFGTPIKTSTIKNPFGSNVRMVV